MTEGGKLTIKLKVAEADQRDVGKGIVRIDEGFREKLGLKPFDVLEIKGGKSTSALVGRPYPSDSGLDIVRMDGLIRTNAKISIGEYVDIRKADWKEAKSVTLAPVARGMQIYAPSETLKAIFMNRTVSKGDFISTTSLKRSRERETIVKESCSKIFSGLFRSGSRAVFRAWGNKITGGLYFVGWDSENYRHDTGRAPTGGYGNNPRAEYSYCHV